MADCSEIAPLLGFFEDSELEPHEMQEVARHLAYCKGCEATLSDYTTLARHLRAAVVEPSLDKFAKTVQRRIGELSVPLRVRIERRLESLTERWTAGLALASAALALGAWVLLFAPFAQRYLGGHQDTNVAASSQAPTEAAPRDESETAAESAPAEDAQQTVISRLEAKTPDVAVWSEPETKTTVIWLPDEP